MCERYRVEDNMFMHGELNIQRSLDTKLMKP